MKGSGRVKMQTCEHCGQYLIIGFTAEIDRDGSNSPDIVCTNCGQLNTPKLDVYEQKTDTMCVMCGVDYGTLERRDGKYYCTHCWGVWNS